MPSSRKLLAVAMALVLVTTGAVGVMGSVTAQSETTDCSFPLTVTDATGEEVEIEEPPESVVTLAPSAAQTMWEIGAQEQVVGISDRGTYLEGADDKTIVSGEEGFVSTETVIAEEPDLVLAPDIINDDKVTQLREAGLTVYNFDAATSMEDIVEKTRLTGQITNSCEGADARADEMENSLEIVRTAVEGEDRPTVLYLLGGEFTAGSGTFINGVIETAGGTNIAAEAGIEGYAQISREVVANESPEYLVVSNEAPEVVPNAPAYNNTDAVQNDQIITVNANYLNQPAPRTIQVVEDFASEWHPDAYESAAASLSEDTTVTTTATDAPGFGMITALLALVGTVFLTRRD
ncbi:PGF-CTERM-anchored ABC transporter substrate-binding protein [Halodesulfurarchaeum sp.]|uniref:PGF-CTERM-anchored ABC transporter substrate-binding protein n=1 Tax=Halodesulfurarchaeum sp. TaxID=1980530 RepID=UPI002FC34CE0